MADLTITSDNVAQEEENVVLQPAEFGETVTKGQAVYKKSDNKWWLANSTDDTKPAQGIVMMAQSANGHGQVATAGKINIGATLTQGAQYVSSAATDGGVAPESDLVTGNKIHEIGRAASTSVLELRFWASDISKP